LPSSSPTAFPGQRADPETDDTGQANTKNLTYPRLAAFNAPIHRVRSRIEKIFGTWKRSYGLRRMRWTGIANAAAQVHLTAIAYNLKRTLTITAKPA
jgi:Transposase DDE domain